MHYEKDAARCCVQQKHEAAAAAASAAHTVAGSEGNRSMSSASSATFVPTARTCTRCQAARTAAYLRRARRHICGAHGGISAAGSHVFFLLWQQPLEKSVHLLRRRLATMEVSQREAWEVIMRRDGILSPCHRPGLGNLAALLARVRRHWAAQKHGPRKQWLRV